MARPRLTAAAYRARSIRSTMLDERSRSQAPMDQANRSRKSPKQVSHTQL